MSEIGIQGEVSIRWGRSREHAGLYSLTIRSGERSCRYVGTVSAIMALVAPAFNRIPWADGEFVLPPQIEPGNRPAPMPCGAE
jgi:hypothetical protein